MTVRVAIVAVALAGTAALATSLEDCERVLSQFQTEVAEVPIAGDHAPKNSAALRGKFGDVVRAGAEGNVKSALERLAKFRQQVAGMEQRGELSRFDADRMVGGARAASECLQRVQTGR